MYSGTWVIVGVKIERIILAPFRKRNCVNDVMKDVKFDIDWVDFFFNTLWALYNIFHNGLILHK